MGDSGLSAEVTEAQPAGFNPWRGRLILLALVHVVGTAGYMSVMAMAPVIRTDMGITAASFGFFMSALFGAQAVAALPSGMITDRLGVGTTLSLSMAMMAAGTALFATADSFASALSAAFLMGLGYTFVNPATAKGVLEWFPRRRRATAMGLKQLGVPLGGVVGAGAGALAAVVDWRLLLWVAAGMAVATAFAWLRFAHRPQRGGGGLRQMLRDLKSVLGNRGLSAICFSCTAFNMGQSSLFAYLALFLRDAAMVSQPVAGLGVAFAQGASAVGRVGYSYLSDTLFGGRRKWVVIWLIVGAFGSCAVAYFVGPGWPRWALMGLAVLMGGTIASYAALILAMAAEAVEPRLTGSAIGYNAVAWSLGGMVGPPLFGFVLDRSGNDYGLAWIVLGSLMLLGALLLGKGYRERAGDARDGFRTGTG